VSRFTLTFWAGLTLAVPSALAQTPVSPSAAAIVSQSATENAEALRLAREIVAIAFPPEQQSATMHQLLVAFTQQMKTAWASDLNDPGLNTILDRYIASIPDRLMPLINQHMPLMLDATAQAYTREFSLSEIVQLRAFAGTAVGTHMLSRGTALLSDPAVAQANQAYLRELQSLNAQASSELRGEVEAYLSKKRGD
jgi:hypothetical protein